MAKINTESITGYADMTPEQKLAALENYEFQSDYSGYIKKELYEKVSADLAARKQAARANLTASEQAMQEMREQMDTMAQTLRGYKREKDIANLTAKYTELGYGDLSEATAIAHLDGDNDTLFKNQQMVFDRTTADKKQEIAEMQDILAGKAKEPEQQQPEPEYDDFADGLSGKPILTQKRLAARKQQQQQGQSPSPGTKEFEAGFLSSFDNYRKY